MTNSILPMFVQLRRRKVVSTRKVAYDVIHSGDMHIDIAWVYAGQLSYLLNYPSNSASKGGRELKLNSLSAGGSQEFEEWSQNI